MTALNTIVIIAHIERIKVGEFQAIKCWEQSRMGWSWCCAIRRSCATRLSVVAGEGERIWNSVSDLHLRMI